MTYQVSGPSGMRHKVEADMPTNDEALKILRGAVPVLACGQRLSKVVNFYKSDARVLPSCACSRCFPPDPTLPKGATVVWEGTNTQVILTQSGFYSRCMRCPWVTETEHAKYKARQAAEAHEVG